MQKKETWDFLTANSKKNKGLEKAKCPACIDQRTDKKDKSLSINHNIGAAKCHYCEAVAFKDDEQKPDTERIYKEVNYKFENYTTLSDTWVKYLDGRKIAQSVIKALGWTETKGRLTFNFFEKGKIVNQKFRTLDKKFVQTSGTKPILYNIDAALSEEELWIVEGEMDVASLYAIGITNVVSVPSGANDNDLYWQNSWEYLQEVKTFIIATDMDEKGTALREALAHRLGKFRCVYVEFKGKDANDDLISGDLTISVKTRHQFKIEGLVQFGDMMKDIVKLYTHGLPKTYSPQGADWGDFKEKFSVLPGQLTTITGIPGHGKSEFIDWLVLNLMKDYNLKACWYSPEHSPVELYATKFLEKITGKRFWEKAHNIMRPRLHDGELNRFEAWVKNRIYIQNQDVLKTTWGTILQTARDAVAIHGVNIFVIDAFNKVQMDDKKESQLRNIQDTLQNLSAFARSTDTMIFLIAHPTKQKDSEGRVRIPTMYDISGSADFFNMSDNGLTIFRDKTEGDKTRVINTKVKNGFQGTAGEETTFFFNPENKRFHFSKPNFEDWTNPTEKVEKEIKEDYVPF